MSCRVERDCHHKFLVRILGAIEDVDRGLSGRDIVPSAKPTATVLKGGHAEKIKRI